MATGGYADRLLVELAANAVDAAREAGRPGRVRFTLTGQPGGSDAGELRAANDGAALTAAGVSGLASLRASSKRAVRASSSMDLATDPATDLATDRTGEAPARVAVGHFGVGFTAVMAVTDEPTVISRSGGVTFSRLRTATAIAELGNAELAQELDARAGQVPALRLPWPTTDADPVPDGFDTEVRLPLRQGVRDALMQLLAEVGDELLWALPGLTTLEIALPGVPLRIVTREDLEDGVTVIATGRSDAPETWGLVRYLTAARHGTIPAELLADRPVEERGRDQWTLTWIFPEPSDTPPTILDLFDVIEAPPPHFLGAPTPTDEPLSVPARLVGTFPVDDTRRRLAAGALTDYLLGQAADGYLDLVTTVAPAHRLSLVPTGGFPLGPIDATLRSGIVRRMSRAPVLVTVSDDAAVPSSACVVTGITDVAAELLGRAVPGLLAPPNHPRQLDALRVLGVSVLPLSDATSALAGLDGEPSFWRDVYEALADQDAEDLADLPVPLVGGGRRIGPAGMLLPGSDLIDRAVLDRAVALVPDLRIVHPDAAHPLLSRLGAVVADAQALSADPGLIELFHFFREDLEDDDPDPDRLRDLADLALDLALAGAPSGGLFDDVVLTDADGQAWPASELLAPGAPLAAVLASDADLPMVGAPWADLPAETLALIGVRTGVKVIRVATQDADLPDLDEWWAEVVGDDLPPEPFDAIADLDLIDDDRWPELLTLLAMDRAALGTLGSGPEPSYTRWWLGRFALLAGEPPGFWRQPTATSLAGLYDVVPVAVEPALAAAIGILTSADDADGQDLLDRLADPGRRVPAGAVPALTAAAVQVLGRRRDLRLPDSVRTLSGAVIPADDALVLDQPWLAQVIEAGRLVAGGADPGTVARALELDLASDSVKVKLVGTGVALSVDESSAVDRAALAIGAGLDVTAHRVLSHPGLSVVHGRAMVPVRWWPGPGGAWLTDGSADGLGRCVAHLAGRWSDRAIAVQAAAGDPLTFAENGLT